MPTLLRVEGIRFFFFSNEGSEPPHVHVEWAECYAKFWLNPVSLARSVGCRPADLRRIRELVDRHSVLFEERWNEYFPS